MELMDKIVYNDISSGRYLCNKIALNIDYSKASIIKRFDYPKISLKL